MSRYALIDGSGKCVNVVNWDGDTSKWNPAPLTAVAYNPAVHAVDVPPEQVTQRTIQDYLVQRRARLTTIRTQAQAVSARAALSGNPTAAQMTTLQTDIKTLAAAIDDLAQYDIRAGRAILGQYDGTD